MDLNKARKDIETLVGKGAPDDVIQDYMNDHGLTKNMLRDHENRSRGIIDQTLDVAEYPINFAHGNLMGAAKWVGDIYRGNVDPAYKDLDGFKGQGLYGSIQSRREVMDPIIESQYTTITDKGYGNVIKKSLGDRLQDVREDKFGQEIISYQGDDGQQYQTYVNKPGLDKHDVMRFAAASIPFMMPAGAVGKAGQMAGLGLKGRMAAQGVTAGIVDAEMQNIAQDQGSGEDYDLARSLIASLGGAGGEVLGTAITKIASKGYIDKATGKLNERGREWAKANRIDPDATSENVANYISQNIDKSADPTELAIKARTGEFDIPTSRAQRTKSYEDAFNELQIEKGIHGQEAEAILKKFRAEQKDAIQDAAFEKVGQKFAPGQDVTNTQALGGNIQEGLADFHKAVKSKESKLWSEIGPMYPKDEAFDSLPDIISKKADEAGIRLLPQGTEASGQMAKMMQQFMNGDLKSAGHGILKTRANDNGLAPRGSLKDFLLNTHKEDNIPATRIYELFNEFRIDNGLPELTVDEITEQINKHGLKPKRFAGRIRYDLSELKASNNTLNLDKSVKDGVVSIDEARRMLLATKNAAQPGSPDAKLANKLYEGFNEWIDDAAEKALIVADDPAAHAALKSARSYTHALHQVFSPKNKRGKLTAAGRKLQQVLENENYSPQEVVSAIFGRGSAVNELPKGTEATLEHLLAAFDLGNLGNQQAKQAALGSLKLAYWARLVVDKNGKALSPKRMSNNIEAAMHKHKGAIDLLFDKQEKNLIKRFNQVLNDLHVEHPNPSLSSIGMAHNTRKAVKGLMNATQQRMRLVKGEVMKANLLSFLSKYVDTPIVNTGRILGNRQISQKIRTRSRNNLDVMGGLGASVNVQKEY